MKMQAIPIVSLEEVTRFKYYDIIMYRFVAGDVLGNGKTDMGSVRKCLEYVVGKSTPTTDELLLSDFNMNGKIDLSDTLNVLQIAEASRKPIFIAGKQLTIDTEIIKGSILGVLIHINTPNAFTFSIGQNWYCVQNKTCIYIENLEHPSSLDIIGIFENPGSTVERFEVVFERDGIMYYVRE